MCFSTISGTTAILEEGLRFGQKFKFHFPAVWVSLNSVDDCVHECQARASCSHVNYFRTAHLCEIDVSPSVPDVISVTSPRVVSWKKPSNIQVCVFQDIVLSNAVCFVRNSVLQQAFSACVVAVKCRLVLHYCIVIYFWSSGIMGCLLFTFENSVPLMR